MHQVIMFMVLSFLMLSQYAVCNSQLSMKEYDAKELFKILKYNQSRIQLKLSPIYLSAKLNKIATAEAQRLAELGELEYPDIDMDTKFRGYSVKVTGIDNDQYQGDKLCFHNDQNVDEMAKVMNINSKCEDKVDWKLDYYVGYGGAYDPDHNIISVRLYTPLKEEKTTTTTTTISTTEATTNDTDSESDNSKITESKDNDEEENTEDDSQDMETPSIISTTRRSPKTKTAKTTTEIAPEQTDSKSVMIAKMVSIMNEFKNENTIRTNQLITKVLELLENFNK